MLVCLFFNFLRSYTETKSKELKNRFDLELETLTNALAVQNIGQG